MRINAKVLRALEGHAARKTQRTAHSSFQHLPGRGEAPNAALGAAGEELAARYIADLGWRIVDRNVRIGHCEIDIVARDGEELVFVEVRTRRDNPVAAPEETVGPAKLEKLCRAASLWTQKMNYGGFWRVDLIAVTVSGSGEMKPEHIKSITEPTA